MEKGDPIIVTEFDYFRLCKLVNAEGSFRLAESDPLAVLGTEIKRAKKVDPRRIPPDLVTMNSRIEVVDPDTYKMMILQLVYPRDVDDKQDRISVLSTLGRALLGHRVGSVVSFNTPKGIKKIKISRMIYQPEANGNYSV